MRHFTSILIDDPKSIFSLSVGQLTLSVEARTLAFLHENQLLIFNNTLRWLVLHTWEIKVIIIAAFQEMLPCRGLTVSVRNS